MRVDENCPRQAKQVPASDEPASQGAKVQRSRRRSLRRKQISSLPLFALSTKGLKTLDGIECRGKLSRNGQTHEFTFQATRNTATLYPGPLRESCSLGVSQSHHRGRITHPRTVTWKWRDLCRRMGISYGGMMVRHLKNAIISTAGLLIQSELALYSKPDGRLLETAEDSLHLYERVTFVGIPFRMVRSLTPTTYGSAIGIARISMPCSQHPWTMKCGGTGSAQFHCQSLVRVFAAQFLQWDAGVAHNYETLVQLLPVNAEQYRSTAEKQLMGPLSLLKSLGIVTGVDWAPAKKGIAQFHFHRGSRLSAAPGSNAAVASVRGEEYADAVEVKELRNMKPPEWGIVTEFYRLFTGEAVTNRPKRIWLWPKIC